MNFPSCSYDVKKPVSPFSAGTAWSKAVAVLFEFVRKKELPPFVQLKGAGLFFFVDDVGRSAGGDTKRTGREFRHFTGLFKLSGFGNIIQPLENQEL